MTTPRIVVAIDGGSQSTKVSLIDEFGHVHAQGRSELAPSISPEAGQVVHPDDDIWRSTVEALSIALASYAGSVDDIIGVGLCTIRFCRVLLDHDGELLEPVWSWMDARVAGPNTRGTDAGGVTTSSGYVTYRLTGERRDSVANVEGAWPLNESRTDWADDDALAAWGVNRCQLFELVEPGTMLGRVTDPVAQLTGLPAGLPVFATANDKAVEALGSGLIHADDVVLSLGTYICALTLAAPDSASSPTSYWSNAAAFPSERLAESHGIRRGMWTVSWLRNLLNEGGGDLTDEDLTAEAKRIPIGSHGLVTLLDWLPDAEHPHRRGAMLGFDGRHDGAVMFRSVLEAIAVEMCAHVEAMEAELGRRFSRVIVSGGGARSDLMLEIIAGVFDRPTVRCLVPDAVAMGSAISAFVGANVFHSWQEAVATLVTHSETVTPVPNDVETYRNLRTRYRMTRAALDPLFEQLAQIEPVV